MTDHCGPCKMLDMVINEIIFGNPKINLVHCDIEKSPKYVDRFDIQGTPTLFFMLDGEIRETMTGGQSRETLEEAIFRVMFG